MGATGRIMVRVNDELVLDAGACEEVVGAHGPEWIIHAPPTTLFQQVLAYLREKPDPPKPPSGTFTSREGIAAAALVLRWGSYLSVLLDHGKAVWPEAESSVASRISDAEMARINIEASAALARWIDLFRDDPRGRGYEELVNRALAYLPMPLKRSKAKVSAVCALADPEMAELLVHAANPSSLERARAAAERSPSRILANALVNTAWRNGPVENIHAGAFRGYPLDQRRVTLAEERELMAFASERLALGMSVCLSLATEESRRTWSDQVLPYGLAEAMLITPSGWSTTEASRDVRLPAERAAVLH
ncbi:MAG TPA: hypothetical protein VGK67_15925 [Myxococcales bacterium]|jgi:hypothetical protein